MDKNMIGKRLYALRDKARLNKTETAKRLDIHYNTYSYYERGERVPDVATQIRIAEHYGCTLDYLLGKVDYPNNKILATEKLHDIGVKYLVVAKEMDESQLDDEQLKLIQNLVKNMSKKKRD